MSAEDLSLSDEYRTPARVFVPLHVRYRFTRDVAAARWNAKLPTYWTKRDNALRRRWSGRNWMNPPYSRGNLARWMGYARTEVIRHSAELVGCLVPAYTSEGWWHDAVEAPAGRLLRVTHQ